MDGKKIEIEVETKGFDEATEKVETLVDAYDGFPAQVQLRGNRNCTINIYPTQTKFISYGETVEDPEEEHEDHWNAMVPPEDGSIITNPNGAVIMNYKTFTKLHAEAWKGTDDD